MKLLRAAGWATEETPESFLGPDKFLMYLRCVDALMSMVLSALAKPDCSMAFGCSA